MKTKLLGMIFLAICVMTGCKEQTAEAPAEAEMKEAPDYAAFDEKVAIIKALFAAHEAEDLEAMRGMLSDTLQFSPPAFNGNVWLGKTEMLAGIQGYHENFDDIKWDGGILLPDGSREPAHWSGSVFPEANASSAPDAIRVYGTWTATHTETGKTIGVKFYSILSVDDSGKIASASEYFDVNGLAVQIAAEE